jgi:hypothetical protein
VLVALTTVDEPLQDHAVASPRLMHLLHPPDPGKVRDRNDVLVLDPKHTCIPGVRSELQALIIRCQRVHHRSHITLQHAQIIVRLPRTALSELQACGVALRYRNKLGAGHTRGWTVCRCGCLPGRTSA